MTPVDDDPSQARLRLLDRDAVVELSPGSRSPELDELLLRHDAESFVLLPLIPPRAKPKRRAKLLRKVERRRKGLGKGEWREAELVVGAEDPLPAAYSFDRRRYEARIEGNDLGLAHFYWGCRGGAVEVHEVEMFDDDEPFELSSIRVVSREGLRDLSRTAFEMDRVGESVRAVGGSVGRLASFVTVVIGFAILVGVAAALGFVTPGSGDGPGGRLESLIWILTHPLIVPPIALGMYLRRHFAPRGDGPRRELSEDEAGAAWRESAPHLLAVWGVVLTGVLLLTVARLVAKDELGVVELVDDATTRCLVALWILTPLTYARDTPSAIGACFEAGLTVVLSVIVIKVTLAVMNVVSTMLWKVVVFLVPWELPAWIGATFGATVEVGAELILFTTLIGYTWTKTREHFGRWATVRMERQSAA